MGKNEVSKGIVKCLIREKKVARHFCHECRLRIDIVSASTVASNSSIPRPDIMNLNLCNVS